MHNIFSADHFFIEDGKYNFVPAKLPDAHRACFRGFVGRVKAGDKVAIMSGVPGGGKSFHAERLAGEGYVVVDNTNLSAWEISPYVLAAESAGATVTIFRVACDPAKAFARQSHGVPAVAHERMAQAFAKRDVLPWWNVVEVQN